MLTVLYARSSWRRRFGCGLMAAVLFTVSIYAAEKPASPVDVAIERGEYARAAALQWALVRDSADPRERETAARLAYDWSQYAVLTSICEDWLKREPKTETAHRFLAVAALELDHRSVAARELEWLLVTAYPTPNEGFESLGRSLAELRNRAGVAFVMRKLAAQHPESGEAQLQAASLLLAAGDAADAQAAAQRARELGRRRQGRAFEARAHVLAGDCEQGLALAAPLGTDIRDLDRLTEAWLMMLCERGAEAESILRDLAQRPDQRAAALEALASHELETHRNESAGRHYAELGKAGESAAAQFGLAALAERMGDSGRAAAMYSAITSGRHAVEAQLRAYRLHVASDGADLADRVFDEFVYANPDLRRDLTVGRMLAMAENGRGEEAIALAARVEKAYPDAEEITRAKAEVMVRLGRIVDATAALEGLLSRRPDDPAAQNALGYTLADAGRDLRRADRLLQAACAQAPDNAAYLDSLGWLRFRQHNVLAAREKLTRAYRLQPDAEIAGHLAEVLIASADASEAERFIAVALDRFPSNPRLLRLQQAYSKGAP
jgi:tetratricopeptide (TPR) repeat protein